MDDNNKLTDRESINLIVGMIDNAKQNVLQGFGRYCILWGYLVCMGGLVNFLCYGQQYADLGWWFMLLAGVVGSIVIYLKQRSRVKQYTYTDKIVMGIVFSVSLSIGLLSLLPASGLVQLTQGGYFLFFPCLLILTAFGTFVTGTAYRFKPFMLGAVACWLAAIACLFVDSFRYSMLISVIGFFMAYILPGHLLVYHEKIKAAEV